MWWDSTWFLWKSQFGVRRCATVYSMFYACNCSLDLSISYHKNIQSPGVAYLEFFLTRFKIKETDHKPGDYLVALFSFGRLFRQENPSYRSLKSGNNITAIFMKPTRYEIYCACFNQIIPDWSGIEICWQRAKKWEVERRNSQGLDKVIHVYPTNLAL